MSVTKDTKIEHLMQRNKKGNFISYLTEEERVEHKRIENLAWVKKAVYDLRMEIIKFLGEKCNNCGFSDIRALEIDHVKGNGNQERKEYPVVYTRYKHILTELSKGSVDYQLLCANCNRIKEIEGDLHDR